MDLEFHSALFLNQRVLAYAAANAISVDFASLSLYIYQALLCSLMPNTRYLRIIRNHWPPASNSPPTSPKRLTTSFGHDEPEIERTGTFGFPDTIRRRNLWHCPLTGAQQKSRPSQDSASTIPTNHQRESHQTSYSQ
jgi:hypothetical protein